jgi:hypothetical protein
VAVGSSLPELSPENLELKNAVYYDDDEDTDSLNNCKDTMVNKMKLLEV